jgi:hypothetical protein
MRLRASFACDQAQLLERCADDLEECTMRWLDEGLTLQQASHESGYSMPHLRRLLRRGWLKDVAVEGPVLVRRGDLPKKPQAST